MQVVFEELGLPPITDEEVEASPTLTAAKILAFAMFPMICGRIDEMMKRGTNGLDVVRALAKHGFQDVADSVLTMLKGKVSGDYLHTSALFNNNFDVLSAVNDPNDYEGPGTGYRSRGERWNLLKNIPQAISPEDI